MHNLWATYWIVLGLLASLILSVFFLAILLSFTWFRSRFSLQTREVALDAVLDLAGIAVRSTWKELPVSSKVLYVLLSIFWPFTLCIAISLYTLYHIIRAIFTLGKRAGSALDKVMG
jgi:hypothetical protein